MKNIKIIRLLAWSPFIIQVIYLAYILSLLLVREWFDGVIYDKADQLLHGSIGMKILSTPDSMWAALFLYLFLPIGIMCWLLDKSITKIARSRSEKN
jgi:hypothetical protein